MKIWVKVLIAVSIAIVASLIVFLITFPPNVEAPRLDIENKDNYFHLIRVEIFDSSNHLIFNNSFALDPGELNGSSNPINKETGRYNIKVMVDNNLTKERWIEIWRTTVAIYIGLERQETGLNVEISTIVT